MGARATLLSALGDLVFPSEAPVSSSRILTILDDAGHERYAARQALTRVARSGFLSGERRGRQVWWHITDAGRELIRDGHRRVDSLCDAVKPWDGHWVVLLVSVPHHRRAVRERLHRYLTWSSYGSPVPGVWVCPFVDRQSVAQCAIDHFDLGPSALSFVGPSGVTGLTDREIAERAWDLTSLSRAYDDMVRRHSTVRPQTGPHFVKALLDLDVDLQQLRLQDPQLPEELGQVGTHRASAQALMALKAAWRSAASSYVSTLA
jgi:phenylacetic acid degradation operon negative regulatory protein